MRKCWRISTIIAALMLFLTWGGIDRAIADTDYAQQAIAAFRAGRAVYVDANAGTLTGDANMLNQMLIPSDGVRIALVPDVAIATQAQATAMADMIGVAVPDRIILVMSPSHNAVTGANNLVGGASLPRMLSQASHPGATATAAVRIFIDRVHAIQTPPASSGHPADLLGLALVIVIVMGLLLSAIVAISIIVRHKERKQQLRDATDPLARWLEDLWANIGEHWVGDPSVGDQAMGLLNQAEYLLVQTHTDVDLARAEGKLEWAADLIWRYRGQTDLDWAPAVADSHGENDAATRLLDPGTTSGAICDSGGAGKPETVGAVPDQSSAQPVLVVAGESAEPHVNDMSEMKFSEVPDGVEGQGLTTDLIEGLMPVVGTAAGSESSEPLEIVAEVAAQDATAQVDPAIVTHSEPLGDTSDSLVPEAELKALAPVSIPAKKPVYSGPGGAPRPRKQRRKRH